MIMPFSEDAYDVVVVGGGHAGCEAALAAARMGARALLLTMDEDKIAQMSCNPAIGGIAKGHLVKEIDALGGEMGYNTDQTGIQFRMLNTRNGPAVRSLRVQCDKKQYRLAMQATLRAQSGLATCRGTVDKLEIHSGRVSGVITGSGERIKAKAVILTSGTFLSGLIHIGLTHFPAGRAGEASAEHLSECMRELGFEIGRLKTGTPPRLDRDTIDFSSLAPQPGDEPPPSFSCRTQEILLPQISCHLTYTNAETHGIIRSAVHRSPMYSGTIKSRGPRYCPSIEDKIVRFADKARHQIFLEPEGLTTVEVYPNGLSTSLPLDVQTEMVRSIEGLERAEIMRPGYAIEYDYVEPTQLYSSLETKKVRYLYHAGQINGTTGYEEAAAQGLMAGINAVLSLQGEQPLVLSRDQAYVGVLIDDLVTRGTDGEPYRMFTSRAEYRLLLREDNADLRLTEIGHSIGLATAAAHQRVAVTKAGTSLLMGLLEQKQINPTVEINKRLESIGSAPIRNQTSLAQLLRRPEISVCDIAIFSEELNGFDADVTLQAEVEVKYAGYIDRQMEMVERFKKIENVRVPEDLDYLDIRGLSREACEKLTRIKPKSLGQASRISGITPAAISLLSIYLRKRA